MGRSTRIRGFSFTELKAGLNPAERITWALFQFGPFGLDRALHISGDCLHYLVTDSILLAIRTTPASAASGVLNVDRRNGLPSATASKLYGGSVSAINVSAGV